MGITSYPTPSSGGFPYSSQLPVNASSVILDGELSNSGSYTTTISGNGGLAYLYSSNSLLITINGTTYNLLANQTVASNAFSGSVNATIKNPISAPPTSWTINNGTYSFGNCIFYVKSSGYWISCQWNTSNVMYSTNGISWTSINPYSGSGASLPNYYNAFYYDGTTVMCINGQSVTISTDGVNWTYLGVLNLSFYPQNATLFGNGNGEWLIYDNSGNNSGSGAYSADNGISWTAVSGTGTYGCEVGYVNGYWFAANNIGQSSGTQYLWYAKTPGTWTVNGRQEGSAIQTLSVNNLGFVASGPALFVTSDPSQPNAWAAYTMAFSVYSGINLNLSYVNGYYMTGTYTNDIVQYSSDYITWTLQSVGSTGNPFVSIAGDNAGKFVAVSSVQSSTNNIAISTPTYPVTPTKPIRFGIYAGPSAIH